MLRLTDGSQLVSRTRGQGNAGNVIINASDILFSEQSGAFNIVEPEAVGNSGSIRIATGSLSLESALGLFTSSRGQGNAGDIIIDAKQVSLNNQSDIFSNLEAGAIGKSGDIRISTNSLSVTNGSRLRVEETGIGNGGNIQIKTDSLSITNGKGGDGGNININSKYIIGLPQEDSDITANAYTGTGGQVQINSQGIFGIEARSQPTSKSDITASSELGIAGVTNINSPDTSSLRNSLNQLPENVIDTNALLANSCIARRQNEQGGTFLITAGDGLPERPGDAPLEPFSTGAMQSIPIETELPKTTNQSRSWKIGDPIIEPQGLYRLANGKLVLSRDCP